MNASERHIKREYQGQSSTVQLLHKEGTTAYVTAYAGLSKAPTAIPLKGLTDKPVWEHQEPLTVEEL